MYAHFYGKIDSILKDKVIIDVNNIGYEIYILSLTVKKWKYAPVT